MAMVKAFWRGETGATSIEYALIATLISLLVVAGATVIGTKLSATFAKVSGNLT